MKKKALITGAAGFLGRYAAQECRRQGVYVVGIGHGDLGKDIASKDGIDEWISSDITMESLKSLSFLPDILIHCAGSGSVGFSVQNPLEDCARTVLSAYFALEYVRLYSPRTVFVYPSSAAVYGESQRMPICEDMSLNPISPYGVHKKMAEELCAMYARQYQVRCTVLRFFSIYGEKLKKQLLWDACNKLADGNVSFWGTGQEVRDWVHAEDAARALLLGALHASTECPVVNVGSGAGTPVRTVLERLFLSYGREDEPCFTGAENAGNPAKYIADITRIRSWGWSPEIPLDRGIDRYVRWYRSVAGPAEH